jgi:hypothetical protein
VKKLFKIDTGASSPSNSTSAVMISGENPATQLTDNFPHQLRPFSTLIIDSLMSHFRTEFCGRGELAERQQTLSKHLSQIARIAMEHNVAVVVCVSMSLKMLNMRYFSIIDFPPILIAGRIFCLQD